MDFTEKARDYLNFDFSDSFKKKILGDDEVHTKLHETVNVCIIQS